MSPDDLSVLGAGNTFSIYDLDKRLSTVQPPLDRACAKAVGMLLDLMGKRPEKRGPPLVEALDTRFVPGETVKARN